MERIFSTVPNSNLSDFCVDCGGTIPGRGVRNFLSSPHIHKHPGDHIHVAERDCL